MPTMRLTPASTEDYRRLAEKRLPRPLFDYLDGGAYQEQTLRDNVTDFQTLKLKQRVLCDVSDISTSTTLLGEPISMPLALSPIGMGGMMARRGETQAVKAAELAGIPFCLSTPAVCSLEEVAKAATKPFWFQLYMMRDRGHVRDLLGRAKAVGCKTLVFTVDLPVLGARYRDIRNSIGGGVGLLGKLRGALEYPAHPGWLYDVAIKGKPLTFGNLTDYVPNATQPAQFKQWIDEQFDPSVTWKDIEWLREIWDGNLIIKGILAVEGATAAADAGAQAVIVSNHGGRQLDSVHSSITALPAIVDAVGDRLDIIVDGGVRSGLDVVKAIACGAKAAMIGRPWIWAIAARGESGLTDLLNTFSSEMNVAMALTGVTSIPALGPSILDKPIGETR